MAYPTISIEDLDQLVAIQDETTARWHHEKIDLPEDQWLLEALKNHAENYQLWHEEDKARRDDMGFEYVYNAKRAIDGHNQRRNNQMEAMDNILFEHFNCSHDSDLPIHTETPGMIIDRLSILSLKIYHMAEQLERDDVDDNHKQQCLNKLNILKLQRQDLLTALQQLFAELKNQTRTFRLYKQMKMYNDATLNPQLYKQQ